jgi:hypothetical protein
MQILSLNLALVKNVDIASSICIIVEVIAEEFSWKTYHLSIDYI